MAEVSKEISFLKNLGALPGIEGIGDDCSYRLIDDGRYLLISTDMLVEGNHFQEGEKRLDLIGEKAVTVNVSDILAMRGYPVDLYIALALPKSFTEEDLELLYQGLLEAADYFNIPVSGGDITSTDHNLVVSVTVTGEVSCDRLVKRSTARPGDKVYVSGHLGGAKVRGYSLWHPYYKILPAALVRKLDKVNINAMTDISDGLSRSLYDLSLSSNVGFCINKDAVPLADGAVIEDALQGGEDYQLLLTVDRENVGTIPQELIYIGEVTEDPGQIILASADGHVESLKEYGYDHFR